MIPTKRLRRTAAVALAVPLVVMFSAACGSEDADAVTVSGKPGSEPELSIDTEAEIGEEAAATVLTEGKGTKVAQGAFVRLDIVAKNVQDDSELVNTWASSVEGNKKLRRQMVTQAGEEGTIPAAVTEHLVGESVGSRVLVEGPAEELVGAAVVEQLPSVNEGDGMAWVLDVVAVADVDLTAMAEGDQAAVEEGMPEVAAEGAKAATITIPKGQKPPGELREQVLIEGDGAEVAAGQALIAQYTGVTWDDGKKFDSSWDQGSALGFQIGTGSVITGWDEGLVGKHVGDRVLLVLPPDKGYGAEGSGSGAIPGGATLVFVVDILGVA